MAQMCKTVKEVFVDEIQQIIAIWQRIGIINSHCTEKEPFMDESKKLPLSVHSCLLRFCGMSEILLWKKNSLGVDMQ